MNPKLHFQGHMVWERLGDGALRTGDYILEDLGQRYMLRRPHRTSLTPFRTTSGAN